MISRERDSSEPLVQPGAERLLLQTKGVLMHTLPMRTDGSERRNYTYMLVTLEARTRELAPMIHSTIGVSYWKQTHAYRCIALSVGVAGRR